MKMSVVYFKMQNDAPRNADSVRDAIQLTPQQIDIKIRPSEWCFLYCRYINTLVLLYFSVFNFCELVSDLLNSDCSVHVDIPIIKFILLSTCMYTYTHSAAIKDQCVSVRQKNIA